MSMIDRAAQFSPFAALTGYEEVIEESGRLTQSAVELTESAIEQLDEKLQLLAKNSHLNPQVSVTYFEPDRRKDGGKYVTVTGFVKGIDTYRQILCLTDSREIPLSSICHIL